MSSRKRGAQPGNQNALKHGRYTAAAKAARREAARARQQAEHERSRAWAAGAPAIDYKTICAHLRRLKERNDD